MDADLKARWIAALKGPYADKKGTAYLCKDGKMCCLGVLADIEGDLSPSPNSLTNTMCLYGVPDYDSVLNSEAQGKYGIPEIHHDKLWRLNDKSKTFKRVIKYIEKNL